MTEYEEGDIVVYVEQTFKDYTTVGQVIETPGWVEDIGDESVERSEEYKIKGSPTLPIFQIVHKKWMVGLRENTEPDVERHNWG